MPVSSEHSSDITTATRTLLLEHFSEEALCQWFDPLRINKLPSAHECVIIWPHKLFSVWVNQEKRAALEEALQKVGQHKKNVVYRNPTTPHQNTFFQTQFSQVHADSASKNAPSSLSADGEYVADDEYVYGRMYTLDTFFVNSKNMLPISVLQDIIAKKSVYTSLVLYGNTSTGKSHLAKAMGNALSSVYGNDMLFCGSVDDLAARHTCLSDQGLLRKVTTWKALIIDDIQRISMFPRLSELVPMIFDHFFEAKKPLFCTSSLTPHRWGELPERIASRLEQNLVFMLHEADMDIRLRYAEHISTIKRVHLGRNQLLTLAQQCTSLRRLTGVIERLGAVKYLLGHDISAQDIEKSLAHTADGYSATPQEVIRVVAARCGVKAEEILGEKRQPRVARARQVAMFLCRNLLGSSYPALGRLFGGRDHSTVIHSVKKIQVLSENDIDMNNLITELSLSCRQGSR